MAPAEANSTYEYLRRVRRLRAEYAGRPAEMQSRLQALSRQRDRSQVASREPLTHTRVEVRRVPSRRSESGASTPVTPATPAPRTPPQSPTSSADTAYSAQPTITANATSPTATPAPSSAPGVLGVPTDIANSFAAEVTAAIEGGILRYTARRRLLARAERLNIGRFDANLLIASVLHAHNPTNIQPAASSKTPIWVTIIALQAALATAAWFLL